MAKPKINYELLKYHLNLENLSRENERRIEEGGEKQRVLWFRDGIIPIIEMGYLHEILRKCEE